MIVLVTILRYKELQGGELREFPEGGRTVVICVLCVGFECLAEESKVEIVSAMTSLVAGER